MQNKTIMFFHSAAISNQGGEERVIGQYANYFVNQGHSVIIIHLGKKNTCLFSLNAKIKLITIKKNRLLLVASFIIQLIKFKPQIIIAVDYLANRYAAIAKYILKNIIVIGTEHFAAKRSDKNRFGSGFQGIKKYLYHRLDCLVVLTKASCKWLKNNTTLQQTTVIANPITYPLPILTPIIAPSKFIKPFTKTLLAIGRLEHQKGFDLLIDIFAKIADKNKNWQLIIIGEGKQRLTLEQQISKLNLQDRVLLPGFVGNLHDWYKAVNIFLFTSRFEGFGCSLAEAMAYGLPVISFACDDGPDEIIEHEINGLLVEAENSEKFVQELSRLMLDTPLQNRLATAAKLVKNRYDINNIGKKWFELFAQLENKQQC